MARRTVSALAPTIFVPSIWYDTTFQRSILDYFGCNPKMEFHPGVRTNIQPNPGVETYVKTSTMSRPLIVGLFTDVLTVNTRSVDDKNNKNRDDDNNTNNKRRQQSTRKKDHR